MKRMKIGQKIVKGRKKEKMVERRNKMATVS